MREQLKKQVNVNSKIANFSRSALILFSCAWSYTATCFLWHHRAQLSLEVHHYSISEKFDLYELLG